MNRATKLSIAALVALVAAGVAVFLSSHDPAVPTAKAPRGEFASERASEEILPSKP